MEAQYSNEHNLSIIVPAFNEAESLPGVLESLVSLGQNFEIIVVDDGSEDKTSDVAASFPVKIIRHPYNKGYGASLKTGIRNAKNNLIVFFDADGQHKPEDIKRLLAEADKYDLIIGARTGRSNQTWLRRPGKFVLGFVANFLTGHKIKDLNSGLRLFHKNVINFFIDMMPNGFSFSTTSTIAAYYFGFSVGYIPIITDRRSGGISSVRQVKHGPETILLILRLITLFEPLKVFLPVSLFLFVAGLISSFVDIFLNKQGIADTTILFFLSFLIIFFMGLVTDQISSIRKENRKNNN
jgi:glycosyltransferase involved in cell wall biosynthesis